MAVLLSRIIKLIMSLILGVYIPSGAAITPITLTNEKVFDAAPIEQSDFALDYNGKTYSIGGEASPFIQAIEQHTGTMNLISCEACLYQGEDKEYSNDEIVIATIPAGRNGTDIIESVLVVGGEWETFRGIRAGSTLNDVMEAYGSECVVDWDQLIYSAGELSVSPVIIFQIEDDVVIAFYLYGNTQK